MKYTLLCAMVLALSVGSCAKKPVVKKDRDIKETDMVDLTGKVGPVEIGYSGRMYMINFDFDKSRLSVDARDILRNNAEWLKENRNINVQIEGHCDSRGTEGYNLALGQKRSDAVRDYLIDLGVPARRLNTLSYGEAQPLDPDDVESAWAKNRRAEFIITDK